MTHDPTPALPACGARRPGWTDGPAIGRHRIPCTLPAGHDGDHRNALGQSWPLFCEDCKTTAAPLESLTISSPSGGLREGHLCTPCSDACNLTPQHGRTATVHTIDRGPVTVTCPSWCTGQHEDGLDLVDVTHESADIEFLVQTERGPVELVHLLFTSYPFATKAEDRGIRVVAQMEADYFNFRTDTALYRLADEVAAHAVRIRAVARQLAELQAEEGAR